MKALKLTTFFFLSTISNLVFADTFFQTPSGNIFCQGSDKDVTCLIGNAEKTINARCGKADTFSIAKNSSKTELVCGGDAGYDDEFKILNYGKSISGNGWQCISQPTGLVCRNNKSHGFSLNRTKQHTF